MGWFSTAFTRETSLYRAEVNRRLAEAITPWQIFNSGFSYRYVGETLPGGRVRTPIVEQSAGTVRRVDWAGSRPRSPWRTAPA